MLSVRRITLPALMLLGFVSYTLHAQSTEVDLQAQLVGKLVYLRGCWDSEDLHFGKNGKLHGFSDRTSIMLCGFVPASVQLERKKLVLKGFRVGLAVQNDDLEQFSTKIPLQIEIDTPGDGDYSLALSKVFSPTLADMAPMLPDYWQKYAREHFSQAVPLVALASLDGQPVKKFDPKHPPKLIKAVEPEFSKEARVDKFNGSVTATLWVGIDGIPFCFLITRSAGHGLDENALAALRQYRFEPATENGKPVPFEINVDVDFQIH
ncbi:MAG: energy transducer TonB [Acidobacteriaceae bacterium]|nr:energy transducer TonB [Acidobacteriaceae bacterium]